MMYKFAASAGNVSKEGGSRDVQNSIDSPWTEHVERGKPVYRLDGRGSD